MEEQYDDDFEQEFNTGPASIPKQNSIKKLQNKGVTERGK